MTTITFTGGDSRDFVVLTASGNCSNAHLIQSSTDSFARVPIGDMVQTSTSMNATTELTLCYSAWQTGGDTDGDFVALDATFEQTTPFTFGPLRIVTGAAQVINLNNISNGDQVKFVQSPNCSSSLMSSAATAEASAVYFLGSDSTSGSGSGSGSSSGSGSGSGSGSVSFNSQDVVLHTSAANGTFYACYKPNGGMWTRVLSVAQRATSFSVISKPTFFTDVGMAGHVTPLIFRGSAQDGDFITLQQNDCSNAHSAVDTDSSRHITIQSGQISTTSSMLDAPVELVACFGKPLTKQNTSR